MQLETVSVLENETGKLYKLEVTSSVQVLQGRIVDVEYKSLNDMTLFEFEICLMAAAVVIYGLIEHSKTEPKGILNEAIEKFTLVELEDGDEAETIGPLASRTRKEAESVKLHTEQSNH